MTALPFTDVEKQKLQLQKNPVFSVFVPFNLNDFERSRIIRVIPINHIVNYILLNVEEPFNVSTTELLIGSDSNERSFLNASVTNRGTVGFISPQFAAQQIDFGRKLLASTNVRLTIRNNNNQKPIQGSGFIVLQHVSLDLMIRG